MKKSVTKAEEARARAIVQRAADQQRKREADEKRKLIGRCFKYRNSFSSDESWWLYAVVTAVDSDGRIATTQMQLNSMDGISIASEVYGGLLPHGGWIAIDRVEFEAGALEIGIAFLQRLSAATKAGAVARCSTN